MNKLGLAFGLWVVCGAVWAQGTVGELTAQGGKKLTQGDYQALMPAKLEYVWPNRQGEGDLTFNADGTLQGSEYHLSSRSTSPATGTWVVDESGKFCTKKSMSVWNSKTDMCWFTFVINDKYFYANSDSDPAAKLVSIKSLRKLN